jgi:hypothetical protein
MILLDNIFLRNSILHLVLCMVIVLFSQTVTASGRIGLVKTYSPAATVIRQGNEFNIEMGSKIFEGDTITTESDGTVGIVFSDGSVLTLGPNGKVIVDTFMFNLAENKFSFLSQVLKGTVVFLSGAIGKISPGFIQFKTPDTTLGLRGTKIVIEVD